VKFIMDKQKPDMPTERIAEFCQRNHIRKLSLFGSAIHGNATPESDMDFLVEFEPGATPGYLGLARMERELSEIIGGRKADLRTPNELSRYFREEVLAEAEVQYAQR
jgi:hypothetical protein